MKTDQELATLYEEIESLRGQEYDQLCIVRVATAKMVDLANERTRKEEALRNRVTMRRWFRVLFGDPFKLGRRPLDPIMTDGDRRPRQREGV